MVLEQDWPFICKRLIVLMLVSPATLASGITLGKNPPLLDSHLQSTAADNHLCRGLPKTSARMAESLHKYPQTKSCSVGLDS